MRQIRFWLSAVSFSFILMTGCKKEVVTESGSTPNELSIQNKSTRLTAAQSAELLAKLEKLQADLPAGTAEKIKQNATVLLDTDPMFRAQVLRVMNVITPTACDDNTPVNVWLSSQLSDWNSTVVNYVLLTDMLNLPTYDALFFENSSENQYFGVNGEYTQRITKTFKDLQRFWNIQSDNIVLGAMHGDMMMNRDKLIRLYSFAYGMSAAEAADYADFVMAILETFPQLDNGNHPIFTFNAFAQRSQTFAGLGTLPAKIIMGDGVLEGYTAIGYGDVAPQAVLAHEFAHQIQFQLSLFSGPRTPEATRRTELMADAYAAYYLSHARGASMQWKRVQQFFQVFFNTGDCSFTSTNHHGTPTQRIAAAEWGYSVADGAQKQGHILTVQEFVALFDAQLPAILNN